MEFNAFELIQNALTEELLKQGFSAPESYPDENGKAVIYTAEGTAYGLLYDDKAQRFQLRSTMLDADGEPGQWKSLSLWLFDSEEGTRADAESIINDFLEVVRGPKRMAVVQQKKRRNKDDERVIDPLFFMNRLANIFPDVREEMNQEKITYGQIRFVTFTKACVAPKCEELATKSSSQTFKRMCELLDDMYKDGDRDLRSIVTAVLLNSLSDSAYETFREGLGDELKKNMQFTRKLKGKNIKPEKKKAEKKIVAKLDARG